MKLAELINYFRNGGNPEDFYEAQLLDKESEVIEVYMEKPLSLDNDLAFFEIEKTEGKIEYIFNGIKHYYLFDFRYFLDVVEEINSEKNKSMTNAEIADRLLAYAINDA